MAWFLFIDESGQDHVKAPYEVLAGIAIHDQTLWDIIQHLQKAEIAHFGRRYSDGPRELKARKILKTKVFKHANHDCMILPHEVPFLAKEALDDGAVNDSPQHLKALALAKISYVTEVFSLCATYGCKVFASIVEIDAPRGSGDGLRKDYGYLFERFFYFLEDYAIESGVSQQGILVFDELEKSKSHLLVNQAHRYFRDTATGQARSKLVVPEPFFVHSDLTTGVQIADLAAYCISWGFRLSPMGKPMREELRPFGLQLGRMRHRTVRPKNNIADFEIWSFAYINDLRTNFERTIAQ